MEIFEPKVSKVISQKTGDRKFTVNKFIKKSKRIKTTVNWINEDTILYSGIRDYILKNIKTNKKTRIHIQMITPLPSPDGKYILYKTKEKNTELRIYDIDTNDVILLFNETMINSDKVGGTNFFERERDNEENLEKRIITMKYVWTLDSKNIIMNVVENKEKSYIYMIYVENDMTVKLLTKFDLSMRFEFHYMNIYDDTVIFYDTNYMTNDTIIYSFNINTKIILTIKKSYAQQLSCPEISPNGTTIGVIYDDESDIYGYLSNIGLITLKDNELKKITANIKWNKLKWLTDDVLIGLRIYGIYNQLYKIDILENKVEQLTVGTIRILNFDILNKKIVYIGCDIFGDIKIKMLNMNNNETQKISKMCILKNTHFGKVREIKWNGTYKNMTGLLLYPNNYERYRKYGLIVDVHGGGSVGNMNLYGSVFRGRIPSEWFMWIQKKVFVFVPEFRSSSIYGSDALLIEDQQNKDIINGDIEDIESGVDYLISKNLINKKKIMAIGGSAGAHRVNWLPVVSNRYKAIISVDGWNDESGNMTFKYNPINYIDRIQTPMLFIMGNHEMGGVDPNNTIKKYYEKLKEHYIKTEYMYIEDEGHNFYKPENIKKISKKIFEWINRYIN